MFLTSAQPPQPPPFVNFFFFNVRIRQLSPQKIILHLIPLGSLWRKGPSAVLLRRILFKESRRIDSASPPLCYLLLCGFEVLWKILARPPQSLHNGPVKMSPTRRARALWNNTDNLHKHAALVSPTIWAPHYAVALCVTFKIKMTWDCRDGKPDLTPIVK